MAAADKDAPRRPWRDNIEALTMAIVVAVMLKYFVVEAYKIPTGSMQPTLLGNEDTQIFDRIIVDKLSYHFRDPLRWEVVVFKYPLDRSKNFIKRLVGMPGEELRIDRGDLWTRPPGSPESDWKVLRRPRPVQLETWKRLDPADPRYAQWKAEEGTKGWTVEGRAAVHARGDGSALLPSDRGSVVDSYRDGYPGTMATKLAKAVNRNEVGDIRLTGEVAALPGCKRVQVELREGDRRYLFELPGPVAPADARPGISVESLSPGSSALAGEVQGHAPWRLAAGAAVGFAAQNIDDLLTLEIDGEIVAELEVDSVRDQRSWFRLRVEGEGADLSGLELYRDIFYTTDSTPPPHEWSIPPDHYFMLGDNTQDSSDSRAWLFDRWVWPGEGSSGQVVRANLDGATNPMLVTGDPERGTLVWLRDEWGELHVFPRSSATMLERERSPFVPRRSITGRAVLVFWPQVPSLGVWRLKWVH